MRVDVGMVSSELICGVSSVVMATSLFVDCSSELVARGRAHCLRSSGAAEMSKYRVREP